MGQGRQPVATVERKEQILKRRKGAEDFCCNRIQVPLFHFLHSLSPDPSETAYRFVCLTLALWPAQVWQLNPSIFHAYYNLFLAFNIFWVLVGQVPSTAIQWLWQKPNGWWTQCVSIFTESETSLVYIMICLLYLFAYYTSYMYFGAN